jgi:hypothetical protein
MRKRSHWKTDPELPRLILEGVACRELNGTGPAACIRNLPKVGVGDVVVRVSVTGEIEHIEAIHPEANRVPFRNVEILKQGAVDLLESGCALCTNRR